MSLRKITAGQAKDLGFTFDKNEILNYIGGKSEIEIPQQIAGNNIIRIFEGAFKDKGLTSIKLPLTLEFIGDEAFANNHLTQIVLPEKVKSIGKRAFMNNSVDQELILSDKIEYIGEDAFSNALTNLVTCTTPIHAFKDNNPFSLCKGLKFSAGRRTVPYLVIDDSLIACTESINSIPLGVVAIFKDAMLDIELKSISIPSSIRVIGNGAFKGTHVTELYLASKVDFESKDAIPNNTDLFGPYNEKAIEMFGDRYTIVEVDDPENISYQKASDMGLELDSDTGTLTSTRRLEGELLIPDTIEGVKVTAIKDMAFYQNALTKVTTNKSLVHIGDNAFQDNKISNLTLTNGLEEIGRAAFAFNQLTKVTIPESVTKLHKASFSWNPLIEVIMHNPEIKDNVFFHTTDQLTLTTSPESRYETNEQLNMLINKDNNSLVVSTKGYIPNGVESLATESLANVKVKSLYIPEGVVTLGTDVFSGAEIKFIYLPSSVKFIRPDTFNNMLSKDTLVLLANQGSEHLFSKLEGQHIRYTIAFETYPDKAHNMYESSSIFNSND